VLCEAGAAILHLPDFYGPYVHVSTLQNALNEAGPVASAVIGVFMVGYMLPLSQRAGGSIFFPGAATPFALVWIFSGLLFLLNLVDAISLQIRTFRMVRNAAGKRSRVVFGDFIQSAPDPRTRGCAEFSGSERGRSLVGSAKQWDGARSPQCSAAPRPATIAFRLEPMPSTRVL
jgi:hypothetical protein